MYVLYMPPTCGSLCSRAAAKGNAASVLASDGDLYFARRFACRFLRPAQDAPAPTAAASGA
ncbi:hypothetical protein GCWU000341_00299 [Oribacterium sp. oral taxon 078 str. F0262]|nr:hypothetical protein GCWU000341_00299 [Oribacterium sp. oral taxon 078 str. F0262]